MKKLSLKFMLFVILSIFSSLTYADGVFSKYYNGRFYFSIDVPVEKYENGGGETSKLDFVKNSKSIPTKEFFSAYEAGNSDGLTIKDKSENITILAYGTNFLNTEETNGLEDIENIGIALQDGWLITFPQGTTSPWKPIRKGTAHLIKTYKPIVVPIVIDGFRRSFDKKGVVVKKKGVIQRMHIKPPLEIDYERESVEEIVEKVAFAIEQHSSFIKTKEEE